MDAQYKPVIGLEIHAELKTKTKMFCDSLNDPDEKHPNINICPICMGHPGTLPVINEEAINKVIMAGLALNCKIEKNTFFERKNYFYPDLPKGYQISQYLKPLCCSGYLDLCPTSQDGQVGKRIRITRIHLEEDAGRLYHLPDKDYSLVDYNRAGVPLMELVTEPDFETGQEVRDFASELQMIWQYLNISEANMEKGEMRVEVNISLSPSTLSADSGQAGSGQIPTVFGTKVEIKNLNSIKFAVDAVDYEIKRQTELLKAGEKINQETRGWDENKKATFSQRFKEEAHDYRYFPEPDLPPLKIRDKRQETSDKFVIEEIISQMVELPQQRRERFKKQYSLPDHDIELFTTDKELGNYYEHVATELLSFDKLSHLERPAEQHNERLLKLASNYLITELKRMASDVEAEPSDIKITPEMFADFVVRVFHGQVSSSGAQTLLKEMFQTGQSPEKIIKEKDLAQVSDAATLELLVDKVIANNTKAVDDYRNGDEAPLKFLVGMTMRESRGKGNPQLIEQIIKNRLQ